MKPVSDKALDVCCNHKSQAKLVITMANIKLKVYFIFLLQATYDIYVVCSHKKMLV